MQNKIVLKALLMSNSYNSSCPLHHLNRKGLPFNKVGIEVRSMHIIRKTFVSTECHS